jgi:metallo-beta-lactamase family protein
MFRITFLGAVRTVTGSMHLVEAGGARLLLDCGLFQGHREEADRINRGLPVEAAAIDAVVLSHAHLDHCGNLPTLVLRGFRGPVYCTNATRELTELVLRDSAKVQQQDVAFLNKFRPGQPPAIPLYTEDDVERTTRALRGVPYGQTFAVGGARITLLDAGHILGSAITVVEADGRTLVFTGDLGRPGGLLLNDPATAPAADVLLTESTYGGRTHEPIASGATRLGEVVRTTVARGGKVLVPSFAVERTQDLAYALHRLRQTGEVPAVAVFVDSPMATDATEIFRRHAECFREEIRAVLAHEDPFGFRGLRYVRSVTDSKALNDLNEPFVVVATSGMCESGRILHHLRHHLGDAQSSLLLVSYQAAHTLGARLAAGISPVNVFGQPHAVRLQVHTVASFSAHADQDELTAWVRRMASLGRIYCVHGEEEEATALARHLATFGYRAEVPTRLTTVDV